MCSQKPVKPAYQCGRFSLVLACCPGLSDKSRGERRVTAWCRILYEKISVIFMEQSLENYNLLIRILPLEINENHI